MPDHLNSPFLSFSRQNFQLFTIILIVIAMHILLLGMGTFWNPAHPAPKPRSKVLVQTMQLKPFESSAIQTSAPSPAIQPIAAPMPTFNTPIEQPKMETPPPTQPKEDIPPQADLSLQTEEAQVATSVQEAAPIPTPTTPPPVSPPLPIKTESKSQSKTPSPKPALQETPKTTEKKSAPVKKPSETAKKPIKTETAKSKAAEEIEKKRQREQTEAEKKRQREQTEAEKKRQQEIADAERKRQQEIAAAQEALRQKEQALLAKAKENLAKISETRNKIGSSSSSVNLETTALPKELGALQVDALPSEETGSSGERGTKEISYSDEVRYRLKMGLRLPDYGAVEIKLTLDRIGKVVKVETVHSESSKNKAYIESKIPTLVFPSFGQRFQGVAQKTFSYTLQNDS
jgi:colicin import membrane protein